MKEILTPVIFLTYTGVLFFPCSGHRIERSTSCAQKYQVIPNHSACLQKTAIATDSGISDEDKNVIVSKHNEYRSVVNPPAVAMAKMSWDDEIAMIAQKYADACKGLVHDGGRQRSIPEVIWT